MNKAAKLLKALLLIAKQPSLLNKVLDDADINKTEVIRRYNLPAGLKTVELTDLLPGFDITVDPFSAFDGSSPPFDLALLKALAASKKECDYFEIGTWMGESVTNVAAVAKNCVTLNLTDAEMLNMGASEKYVGLHRFFSKDLKNVTHLQANSQTFDFSSLHQKFDLLFIDGDHHYESVKKDSENAFQLLKDENAIIVWHDYGNTSADIRWDVLRGILDGIPAAHHQYLYRVSGTLCAMYTTQPVKAAYLEPYTTPQNYFSVHIKSRQV